MGIGKKKSAACAHAQSQEKRIKNTWELVKDFATCAQAPTQAYYNEGNTIGGGGGQMMPTLHQGPSTLHQGPTTPYLGGGGLLRGQTAQPQVAVAVHHNTEPVLCNGVVHCVHREPPTKTGFSSGCCTL